MPPAHASRRAFRAASCAVPAAALLLLAACGKPPAAGGPPGGDFPTPAVVAPVLRQPLEERLTLVANLRARDTVQIVAEIDAQIVAIGFADGAAVRQGDLLFRLDPAKFQAQLAEAEARVVLARSNLDRARSLADNQTISRQEFDQADSTFRAAQAAADLAREQLADAEIRAPFHGRMSAREASLGQFVARGRLLATLVSNGNLEMEFNVPERHLSKLALGQHVTISTVAYPDESFTGAITYLAPALDPASRTLAVRAELANADGRLRPGLFGRLDLTFRARDDALVIPESALSFRGDAVSVVVRNAEGRAEFRPVQPGLRLGGVAEILSGLAEGEQVVVEGFQKLGPGSLIMISEKSRRYGLEPTPSPGA